MSGTTTQKANSLFDWYNKQGKFKKVAIAALVFFLMAMVGRFFVDEDPAAFLSLKKKVAECLQNDDPERAEQYLNGFSRDGFFCKLISFETRF